MEAQKFFAHYTRKDSLWRKGLITSIIDGKIFQLSTKNTNDKRNFENSPKKLHNMEVKNTGSGSNLQGREGNKEFGLGKCGFDVEDGFKIYHARNADSSVAYRNAGKGSFLVENQLRLASRDFRQFSDNSVQQQKWIEPELKTAGSDFNPRLLKRINTNGPPNFGKNSINRKPKSERPRLRAKSSKIEHHQNSRSDFYQRASIPDISHANDFQNPNFRSTSNQVSYYGKNPVSKAPDLNFSLSQHLASGNPNTRNDFDFGFAVGLQNSGQAGGNLGETPHQFNSQAIPHNQTKRAQEPDESDEDFQPEEPSYAERKASALATRFANMLKKRNNPVEMEILMKRFLKALQNCHLTSSNLPGLRNLLSKFLKCEPLTKKDITISELEIILFIFFLVKKRYMNVQKMEWSVEGLNKMKFKTRKRRNEQNYKMILKRFFKLAIRKFNMQYGVKETEEDQFYEYYFGEFIEKPSRLKFQIIFNETSQRYTENSNPRQNKKFYAETLQRSHEFMDLLDKFLKDEFEDDFGVTGVGQIFLELMESKTNFLVEKWARVFKGSGNIEMKLIDFLRAGLRNTKLKLPWGMGEVRGAVEKVRELFEMQ